MSDETGWTNIERILRDHLLPDIAMFASGLFSRAYPGVVPRVAFIVIPTTGESRPAIVVGDIDGAKLTEKLELAIAEAIDAGKEAAPFSPHPERTDAISDVLRERAAALSAGDDLWLSSRATYRETHDTVALVGVRRSELPGGATLTIGESAAGFVASLQATFADAIAREMDRFDGIWRGFSPSEDVEDLLRDAGEHFMHAVAGTLHNQPFAGFATNQFARINRIASLAYEGGEGRGALVLAAKNDASVARSMTFRRAVPIYEPVWARKMLELSTGNVAVLADDQAIYGLADLAASKPGRFWIQFLGRHTWNLHHGETLLMQTHLGVPSLPAAPFKRQQLESVLSRVLGTQHVDHDAVWQMFETARERQAHGALLVVSSDAAGEAKRLAGNATPIEPTLLDEALVAAATRIDGALILGADGRCHAIGAILDGEARVPGTPARGARFNSALRYVTSESAPLGVALVLSEDGHVDLVPRLRPQISQAELSALLALVRDGTGTEARAAARRLANDYAEYVPPELWQRMLDANVFLKLFVREQRTRYDRHPSDITD